MTFKGKEFEFVFPRPTLIMGILNVTPDSFSDGGRFVDIESAVEEGILMQTQGADIIDIGAESTRPGFVEVPPEEEYKRLQPVVLELKSRLKIPISVDTRHIEIAEKVLRLGADIINDVGLGRKGREMYQLLAEYGAGYILMHSGDITGSLEPEKELNSFFQRELQVALDEGMREDQIVFDPGIGFGKTVEQNLLLIKKAILGKKLGRPLMLGCSRKSFMKILPGGATPAGGGRLGGSLAVACYAAERGIEILRVHDVKETVQAVRLMEKLTWAE